jgi:hypothetical protein
MKSKFIMLALAAFVFTGCVSLMEKTGRAADGSAFKEKTLAVFENPEAGYAEKGITVSRVRRNRDRGEYILIELAAFPTLKLRASTPDMYHRISLESLEFLAPNLSGWNEAERPLAGEGHFKDEWYYGFFFLTGSPEALDISGGRIRRNDERLTGEDALKALHNREERVKVITEWMHSWLLEREERGVFSSQNEFAEFWEPVLFPELAPPKKRPAEWPPAGGRELSRRARGEDILWNLDYTDAVFSETLRPVRNTGTLLRDWEEAQAWIYIDFEWDSIVESLLQEIRLSKIK